MAAEENGDIAEQIAEDPSLVGVTPATERDDETAPVGEGDDGKVTWGDVWQHVGVSGVISKTQAATALEAHPDTPFHKHDAARQRLEQAIDDGDIVQTGDYGLKVAIEEDSNEHV